MLRSLPRTSAAILLVMPLLFAACDELDDDVLLAPTGSRFAAPTVNTLVIPATTLPFQILPVLGCPFAPPFAVAVLLARRPDRRRSDDDGGGPAVRGHGGNPIAGVLRPERSHRPVRLDPRRRRRPADVSVSSDLRVQLPDNSARPARAGGVRQPARPPDGANVRRAVRELTAGHPRRAESLRDPARAGVTAATASRSRPR